MENRLRLYIASAWENRANAKELMAYLEKAGYTITEDWTDHEIDEHDDWRDSPENIRVVAGWANDDIIGVKKADAVILLLAGVPRIGTGSACELGAALAMSKPVFMLGKQDAPESPFLFHGLINRVYTIDELLYGLFILELCQR